MQITSSNMSLQAPLQNLTLRGFVKSGSWGFCGNLPSSWHSPSHSWNSIHKFCSEDDIGVVEHTFFQWYHNKLATSTQWENCSKWSATESQKQSVKQTGISLNSVFWATLHLHIGESKCYYFFNVAYYPIKNNACLPVNVESELWSFYQCSGCDSSQAQHPPAISSNFFSVASKATTYNKPSQRLSLNNKTSIYVRSYPIIKLLIRWSSHNRF